MNSKLLELIGQDDYDDVYSGHWSYEDRAKRVHPTANLPTYKVWNPNPTEKGDATPGIVMTTVEVKGDEKIKHKEVVDSVKAVILYQSPGRKLARGTGKTFQVACQSHDGLRPSLRVEAPLCRKLTAEDVASVFSQWKGYDQARVSAKVQEVTEHTGKLQFCSLKTNDGFIRLCPYAKKDPDTGRAGACKEHIFVHCYDLEREREFKMELTGRSIERGNFTSPFHEFFKGLREQGPVINGKPRGLPCFAFSVTMSSAPSGGFFYLNVTNPTPIESAEERSRYKVKAEKAREAYEKDAHRLSQAEYDKLKSARTVEKGNTQPSPQQTVAFDEDDINF